MLRFAFALLGFVGACSLERSALTLTRVDAGVHLLDGSVFDARFDAPADGSLTDIGNGVDGPTEDGCVKQCAGKQCGPDGCGRLCGACADENEICNDSFMCECLCATGQCRVNSCGRDCGECPVGQICNAGLCTCDNSCAGIQCGTNACGVACSSGCTAPAVCGDDNVCRTPPAACGNPGEMCCSAGVSYCNVGARCEGGVCVQCGVEGNPCCAFGYCEGGRRCIDGRCTGCGGNNAPCCEGRCQIGCSCRSGFCRGFC